jgi:hypothetical protein
MLPLVCTAAADVMARSAQTGLTFLGRTLPLVCTAAADVTTWSTVCVLVLHLGHALDDPVRTGWSFLGHMLPFVCTAAAHGRGRRVVRRPRRAKSDCPTTGDRGAALTLVITFGRDVVCPIQDFKKLQAAGLRTIVWAVCYRGAFAWPLKMVDQLQKDMQSNGHLGRGFFTLSEFLDKSHSKSELHLVMERDENKGKANIYAMLPVEEAEISVRSEDQTSLSPKEPWARRSVLLLLPLQRRPLSRRRRRLSDQATRRQTKRSCHRILTRMRLPPRRLSWRRSREHLGSCL